MVQQLKHCQTKRYLIKIKGEHVEQVTVRVSRTFTGPVFNSELTIPLQHACFRVQMLKQKIFMSKTLVSLFIFSGIIIPLIFSVSFYVHISDSCLWLNCCKYNLSATYTKLHNGCHTCENSRNTCSYSCTICQVIRIKWVTKMWKWEMSELRIWILSFRVFPSPHF